MTSRMTWNWQQPDWPQFTYDKARLNLPVQERIPIFSGDSSLSSE